MQLIISLVLMRYLLISCFSVVAFNRQRKHSTRVTILCGRCFSLNENVLREWINKFVVIKFTAFPFENQLCSVNEFYLCLRTFESRPNREFWRKMKKKILFALQDLYLRRKHHSAKDKHDKYCPDPGSIISMVKKWYIEFLMYAQARPHFEHSGRPVGQATPETIESWLIEDRMCMRS